MQTTRTSLFGFAIAFLLLATGTLGVLTTTGASGNNFFGGTARLFLGDHLGSNSFVIDEAGNTLAEYSFDAWGVARDAVTWADLSYGTAWPAYAADRGFTGHQMLNEHLLVHMNGRIYDPYLGRFLSADPFVQSPGNLQNYNRYSYVLNNPLRYVDPSGYFLADLWDNTIGKLGKAIGRAGSWIDNHIFQPIKPYVGTILTVAFTLAGMPYVGAFVGSAVQTAISGGSIGDFLVGLAIGSFAGYVGGPIAGSISRGLGFAARHLATSLIRGGLTGAIAGATAAVVYGKDIWKAMRSGALWGMATSAVVHLYRAHQANDFIANHLDTDNSLAEFLNSIRDAYQSPVGARALNSYRRSGGTLTLRIDPNDFPGNSSSIAKDSSGNLILDTIHYSASDWNAGTLIHELGHTSAGGFNNISSIDGQRASEIGAIQHFENRWNWWMGLPRRSQYEGLGQSRSFTIPSTNPGYLDSFITVFDPLPVPSRPLLQNILHPGF